MLVPELPDSYMAITATTVSTIVSTLIAWATARSRVRVEVQKLRLGVQQKLLEQLVAARLVVYPDLYTLLSELSKIRRALVKDQTALVDLLDRVNAWDSRHSILLGPHSTNVCYEFRQTLAKAASIASDSASNEANVRKVLEAVLAQAERLELALRSDLGIYGVEVLQAPGLLRTPQVHRY
jgi:hypothetical protein